MKKSSMSFLVCVLVHALLFGSMFSLQARTLPVLKASPDVKTSLGTRWNGSFGVTNYSAWVGRQVKYTATYLTWKNATPGGMTNMFNSFTSDKGICSGLSTREPVTVIISMPMVPDDLPNARSGAGATINNLNRGISGEWDEYYRSIGKRIAERKLGTFWPDGRPKLVIRLGWEHTGAWFSWSSLGAEAQFKALFRHVVQTVESAAGTSVVWEWNGSNNGDRTQILKAYPGDDVVDIVGLDFYDDAYPSLPSLPVDRTEPEYDTAWAKTVNGAGEGKTTGAAGLEWYRNFAKSHGKLLGVSEWGSMRKFSNNVWWGGGDNQIFIQSFFCWASYLAKEGVLAYLSYFEQNHAGSDGKITMWHKLSPGSASAAISVAPGVTTGSTFPKAAAKFIALYGGANDSTSAALDVALTSPMDGSTYLSSATVVLGADVVGSALQVDFFRGSTLVGTARKSPYTVTLTGVKNGNYTYYARVTDKNGHVATSTPSKISVISNMAPKVTLTSPIGGSSVVAPSDILISANVTDTTGTIAKVEFYNGSTLLGTTTQSPYFMIWKNVAAGTYSLKAKATDSGKLAASSATAKITVKTVTGNTAPTVSITSPTSGATFTEPASITMNANAADANGISGVSFYEGSTLLGTDTTAPYSFTWGKVSAGTYSIVAKATDTKGSIKYSSSVKVTVKAKTGNTAPVISISPAGSIASLLAPATVAINATATDSDGSVAKVDFYNGTSLIATDTTVPYSVSLDRLAMGSYSISAIATDNLGATTTSNVINLNVLNTPPVVSLTKPTAGQSYTAPASVAIAANASDANGTIAKVQFYQGTTLLGTDTTSPYSLTWSNVSAGSYSITAKATDNDGAVTTSSAVNITVKSAANLAPVITISPAGSIASLQAPASVTINATATDSDGSVARVDFFNGTTLVGTSSFAPYSVSLSGLAVGSYSITAVATDNSGATTTSNVVSLNVSNTPPVISLTKPTVGQSYTAPASVTMTANASDANGAIVKVQFYHGTTLIGTDTTSPYSLTWKNVVKGTYTITATATDDDGAVTTSSAVSIIVNDAPVVPLTPSGLSLEVISPSQLNLAWADHSGNETGYKVERKTGIDGTYAQIAILGANSVSYQDTGLATHTEYYYRVRATNAVGDSDYSNEANAVTMDTIPAAPSNLKMVVTTSIRLKFSWKDNSTNETGFKIERKKGPLGTYSQVATVGPNVTIFSNGGLLSDTQYFYRVRATNSAGDSEYSQEISGTTLSPTPVITSAATLAVDVNQPVEYAITASGNPLTYGAAGLPTGLTMDSSTGLISGMVNTAGTYPITISASNSGGTGSMGLNLTIQEAPLAVPSNFTAVVDGAVVNLSWSDNSSDETSFRVWRKDGTTGIWAYYATVKGLTTYSDTKVESGKTYTYRVRVRRGETTATGYSAWTSEVTVTIP